MAKIKFGFKNIAESGTTTAVSTDSDYPIHRLFDRYIHLNWRSGSSATATYPDDSLLTNGYFESGTTGWSTDDDCTLGTSSGGRTGDQLTITYSPGSTGSDLVTNGTFETNTDNWSVPSSSYSISIVSSGYSGNCVSLTNYYFGSNLVSNEGFESGTTGWSTSAGTITQVATPRSGTYGGEFTTSTNGSYVYQLITGLKSSIPYRFGVYVRDGSLSSQPITISVRRGSNISSVWDYASHTTTSSYTSRAISFTMPSDETSIYIAVSKNNTSAGSIYVDDFSLHEISTEAQQYLEQTITGLTSEKYYAVNGYVTIPSASYSGAYIIGVYRADTSALISSVSGTTTTSWTAFSQLLFQVPSGQTSVKLRLIRNSSNVGYTRFDSISMYKYNNSSTQSAYQDIATIVGEQYRFAGYMKDGSLTTSPYILQVLDGSTVVDSYSGNTSSSWSSKSIYFTATNTTTRLKLIKNSTSTGSIGFDDFYVKRIVYVYLDQWIQITQSGEEVDSVVMPGHTFDGVDLLFQYSDDGSTWSNAVTPWTQSGDSMIVKTFISPKSSNYFRLYTDSSMYVLPELAEFYVTKFNEISSAPKYTVREGHVPNIKKISADSWKNRYLFNGEKRKTFSYEFPYASSADKTIIEELENECLMKKPFYIYDHNGSVIYVELTDSISIVPINSTHFNIKIELMEVL